jgi:hypothetical protein
MAVGRIGDRAARGQVRDPRRRPLHRPHLPVPHPGHDPPGARRLDHRHRARPRHRPAGSTPRRPGPQGPPRWPARPPGGKSPSPPHAAPPSPPPATAPSPPACPPPSLPLPRHPPRPGQAPLHHRPGPAPRPQNPRPGSHCGVPPDGTSQPASPRHDHRLRPHRRLTPDPPPARLTSTACPARGTSRRPGTTSGSQPCPGTRNHL